MRHGNYGACGGRDPCLMPEGGDARIRIRSHMLLGATRMEKEPATGRAGGSLDNRFLQGRLSVSSVPVCLLGWRYAKAPEPVFHGPASPWRHQLWMRSTTSCWQPGC